MAGQEGQGRPTHAHTSDDDNGFTLHIPFALGAIEMRRGPFFPSYLPSFLPSQSICDRNRLPIWKKNDTGNYLSELGPP